MLITLLVKRYWDLLESVQSELQESSEVLEQVILLVKTVHREFLVGVDFGEAFTEALVAFISTFLVPISFHQFVGLLVWIGVDFIFKQAGRSF